MTMVLQIRIYYIIRKIESRREKPNRGLASLYLRKCHVILEEKKAFLI